MKFLILLLSLIVVLSSVENVTGFAAKKSNNKGRKNAAASNKGFGAAPAQVFDEVVSRFKTRIPEDAPSSPCPCGSGATYAKCCAPYHGGEKFAESATAVLRSRFTAFTWRIIPYVIDSTHPTCRDYMENRIKWAEDLNAGGMFDSFDFVSLEPGPETPGENEKEAFIEFKVRLRANKDCEDALKGQETVICENSRFLCDDNGKWAYSSGDVTSQVEGLEDAILNR
eukprot:CAMPEP_0198285868 /NCGR_PEP_ID=MMETSP1449-20131203/5116_1 /TAXON_ID=420275 /ORGANISM="Attheya septentrionalis, Strain CCMP2084" /LENGTH=225 /DNA_ID=CAMNT_0043983475 /DNA_START=94 /DNA_END=771 /DNA_ORIENTATION=+